MFDKLKNTVKHSAIYSLGNLSAKLVGFILLPIYLNYLSIEEYGILTLLEVTGQIILEVLLISIPTAMMRWYALSKSEAEKKSIVFTSFVFLTFIAIINSIVFIPFSSFFSQLIFSSEIYSDHFTILFIFVSFSIINRFILNLIRIKQKSTFFVVLSLLRFTSILLLNIYFVAYLNWGIKGVLLGLLLGQLIVIILSIKFIINNIIFVLNIKILKEMLKYGFPLIFSTISSMTLSLGDRYLIKFFLGDAAVGVYSVAFKIASLVNVFINSPFQMGFLPIAFNQAKQKNPQRFFSKILTYKTLLLTTIVILISFWGGSIILLLTSKKEYFESIPLISIISFIFIFKGIQYVLSLSFHIINKTTYNAIIVVLGSLLNIGLNVILIPQIGVYGAPISMITSLIVMIFITYFFSQKEYFIPYEVKKIFTIILIGFSYYLIGNILDSFSLIISIPLKLLLLLIFPIILKFFSFFEKVELLRINQSWQKWKTPTRWKKNIKQIKF